MRKLNPSIAVIALSSPLEIGADKAAQKLNETVNELESKGSSVEFNGLVDSATSASKAGIEIVRKGVDCIVAVPVCWCEDYLILDLLEEIRLPVLFRPVPGMETGALCACQQTGCFLKQLDWPFKIVFGEPNNELAVKKSLSYIRAAALKNRLRRAKVGIAGTRAGGMTHTSPNEFFLKRALGPRVVPLDLPGILTEISETDKESVKATWLDLKNKVGKCSVTENDGLEAMKTLQIFSNIVKEEHLDALTVGCYPHLMGKVCLAASLLADEGVPLSCEGDVHGAVAQLMLTLLSEQPTHCTDWLDPMSDESVVFTHCGSSSISLAEKQHQTEIASVRLMDQGACLLYTAKTGPVTMLSLTNAGDKYQLAVLTGNAVSTEMVFPGNPVRVEFEKPLIEIMEWIGNNGIGHHWMIGYGDFSEEISDLNELLSGGINLINC